MLSGKQAVYLETSLDPKCFKRILFPLLWLTESVTLSFATDPALRSNHRTLRFNLV